MAMKVDVVTKRGALARGVLAAVVAGVGLLSGCVQTAPPASRCEDLTGTAIAAETIGLPTRGGRVLSSEWLGPVTSATLNAPEHCHVEGTIAPVDPTAPEIVFELNLPAIWNGSALMLGGGGFDGVVPDVTGPMLAQPADGIPSPLQRGYAVFGSDSGHQAAPGAAPIPAVDAAFALNDEALANYAGDALKKTRDASISLIAAMYGQTPTHTYFAGGSNGGREGLLVAERWPQDFDGVIVAFPFWNAGTTTLTFGAVMNAFAKPGAYLDAAGQTLLYEAVIDSCDELDGVADGLVSNIKACQFDPDSLRCGRDGATSRACLSAPQIAALRKYDGVAAFDYRTPGREKSYPGFPVFQGADLRGPQQLGIKPPSHPAVDEMPVIAHFWDQFARFALARDAAFNAQSLDPERPGALAPRINHVVDLLDLPSPDFKTFRSRGGRLIIYQGLADPIVSPRATEDYWRRLVTGHGRDGVKEFARFYVVPGYGHGPAGHNAFVPVWDVLSSLEHWVEQGAAPGDIVVTDGTAGGHGRTRPLCELGSWPRYKGAGPANDAASFTCVREEAGRE